MVPMVHLIKKLTLHARRTGTDVLHAANGRATGTDTGVASAILSNRSQSKMVVFVRQEIQDVSTFWNKCGSH